MRLRNSFPASPLCLRAIWRHSQFRSRAAGGTQHGPPKLRLKFEVARQVSRPTLCTCVRAVPWADEAEQGLPRQAPSACELSAHVRILRADLRKQTFRTRIPRLRLKFEVARQASIPSLCASVRALPWADETEQELPRLAPSDCELSADVHILRARLRKKPNRDPHPQDMFEV